MSYTSLNSWKQATAQNIIRRLPLQTFDDALVLAEQYLVENGGWEPDDPIQPTGTGEPADGSTPEEASISIVEGQYGRIYQTDLTATVQLHLHYNTNQAPDHDDSSVLSVIENDVRDFIQQRLAGTNIEFVSLENYTGTVDKGGLTTAASRISINQQVESESPFMDIRAVALNAARLRFNLDSTWNVFALYFKPGTPSVCMIRKYENTSYETLEVSEKAQYIFTVDPVTLTPQSGIRTTFS